MADLQDQWVFGYASLIYRPDFRFVERVPGRVHGWARRFWQQSTDHRGTPERPGRVATVIRAPGETLWGMAYRVAAADAPEVMAGLDHREKGGYERHRVPVELGTASVTATMYVGLATNPDFVGPAPLREMAEQIIASRGPSGPNVDYVTRLAEALRDMGVSHDAAFALEAEIQVMMRLAT